MSRVSVRIRPAECHDLDALLALVAAADKRPSPGRDVLDSDEVLAGRLSEIVSCEDRSVLVAVDDAGSPAGAIVGLLVARTDEIGTLELTPAVHVTHLFVAPKHRRRGVGRALLAAAVHLADERGVDRLLATVAAGSRDANRYLARLGFAPLVVHRVATTAALRRSLGLSDAAERMAVLRRARLARTQRPGFGRVVGRGA